MRNTKNKNRDDKKKLSWIYRRKAKSNRLRQAGGDNEIENENENENKRPRIIVRNLPFKTTVDDIKQFYEPFGPIDEINFPKRYDGSPVGCCFIQFKQLEDASKAIFNTNKQKFEGRTISSSWAVSKSRYCEKLKQESTKNVDHKIDHDAKKDEVDTNKQNDECKTEEFVKRKLERRKLQKEKNRKRRARIVIRNLSFQVTEESLKEHFSQYGTIEEVKLLKREDGKHVGCAFLQFEQVQSAAKAIHYGNLQPLLDRPIVVDWAIPKNKFCKNDSDSVEGEMKVKIENESDTENASVIETAKESNSNEELGSEDEKHVDITTENDEFDDNDSIETEIKSENESGASDDELSEDVKEEHVDIKDVKEIKRPRFESHDVSEGKTVFLKNVPFSVKNDQLKKYMEQFGPVYYALVCMDPLTEYSKGTAFVKFRNVEDAEKCLSAGKELEMEDQIVEAQKAIDRNEMDNKALSKQLKIKDSRNLYLVKEGVILAGSSAATGVSAADMAKRLQIEQWKSQILRNFNMFVSRVRLVVHNLPPTVDDVKLRKIFEKHGPSKAIIREVRVMRDLKNVDTKGIGKSKEYGFVSFTKHEDALQALRSVNNNPNVFTSKRRPIVSFSIENRIMVNAKQRRVEKSRKNNPLCPGNKVKRKEETMNEEVPLKKFKPDRTDELNKKPYAGTVGKLGENKLRSKFKLKNQAKLHSETVKKERKMKKSWKKLEEKRRQRNENKKEIKPKQRTKVKAVDVKLDKLVNSYKNKLKSIELKKSKWYEA
ncbi:RNA-binding protein 28-like isoform X1 [Hylaeus volcanicus]|uniref:RNA-binding protein 28-like isoform X1 n=1 Tax=Hylaeus volcanicus TaxID=313075 RepID=UPI0023B81845|nr:RNA-binding protein 28-like isoform X1 [Hylaeus volcanicus]